MLSNVVVGLLFVVALYIKTIKNNQLSTQGYNFIIVAFELLIRLD